MVDITDKPELKPSGNFGDVTGTFADKRNVFTDSLQPITISTRVVEFKDEEDNVILSAPLLDLSYFIGFAIFDIKASRPELTEQASSVNRMALAEELAIKINAKFNCSLSWGQTSYLMAQVEKHINELKKKNTSPSPVS